MEHMIDISIPRVCVYRRFEEHPGPCPRCGADLQCHYAAYLIATRRGEEVTDSVIMGHDEGWFCPRCPTVVLNPDEISEALLHPLPNWDVGTEFVPLGIVDVDAIPEEKAHLPFGDDDNPIPLVEFTDVIMEEPEEPREPPPRADVQPLVAPGQREGTFEERYQDVLQNIEFGIVSVYHDHPEMSDWEALSAVEALIRRYRAEVKGRQAGPPSLDPLTEEVYYSVERLCEWRLGRKPLLVDKEGQPREVSSNSVTLDEIVDCLKRVRKSINRWTRLGGRQGYLTFVEQFIG
jgi:hypothetical protein